MKTDELHFPEDVERQLSEIFTAQYMEAVKSACRRYLYETAKKKHGVTEDGHALMEISEKAAELRLLLKTNTSALERVYLYVSEEYKKHDTLFWIDDLTERLKILDDMCFVTPARERAANPRKGRPAGTVNEAERGLAFHLWEIYRQAHGKTAPRITETIATERDVIDKECGPLVRAVEIIAPLIKGLSSNLARYFREIGEDHKKQVMDNKSETD